MTTTTTTTTTISPFQPNSKPKKSTRLVSPLALRRQLEQPGRPIPLEDKRVVRLEATRDNIVLFPTPYQPCVQGGRS